MAESNTILERTEQFIKWYKELKDAAQLPDNKELAESLGISSASTISNILARRQNITPKAWTSFKELYLPETQAPEIRSIQNGSPDPLVMLERLSKAHEDYAIGFKALATVVERIERTMALESSLQEVLTGVETISDRQGPAIQKILEGLDELRRR